MYSRGSRKVTSLNPPRSKNWRATLLRHLKKLPARQFENLLYDLLLLSGLRNATWRTPGPDGGRDIEGTVVSIDFSENVTLQKWYVECKRYARSVDWPTVYQKVSYADNHAADYLLIATTANVSPRCKEEIAKWNAERKRPIIRVWDSALLESLVSRHPILMVKYNLSVNNQIVNESLVGVVKLATRVVQAGYGNSCLKGEPDNAIEFGAALIDLISARMAEDSMWSHPKRFIRDRDLYSWTKLTKLKTRDDLDFFDSYSLRAVLAAWRFYTKSKDVVLSQSRKNVLAIKANQHVNSDALRQALVTLGLLSNFEINWTNSAVQLSLRSET